MEGKIYSPEKGKFVSVKTKHGQKVLKIYNEHLLGGDKHHNCAYCNIVNPKTGKLVSTYGQTGGRVIKSYVEQEAGGPIKYYRIKKDEHTRHGYIEKLFGYGTHSKKLYCTKKIWRIFNIRISRNIRSEEITSGIVLKYNRKSKTNSLVLNSHMRKNHSIQIRDIDFEICTKNNGIRKVQIKDFYQMLSNNQLLSNGMPAENAAKIEVQEEENALAREQEEAQAREQARAQAQAQARAQAQAQAHEENALARVQAWEQEETQAREQAQEEVHTKEQARAQAQARVQARKQAKAQAKARANAKAPAKAPAVAQAETSYNNILNFSMNLTPRSHNETNINALEIVYTKFIQIFEYLKYPMSNSEQKDLMTIILNTKFHTFIGTKYYIILNSLDYYFINYDELHHGSNTLIDTVFTSIDGIQQGTRFLNKYKHHLLVQLVDHNHSYLPYNLNTFIEKKGFILIKILFNHFILYHKLEDEFEEFLIDKRRFATSTRIDDVSIMLETIIDFILFICSSNTIPNKIQNKEKMSKFCEAFIDLVNERSNYLD